MLERQHGLKEELDNLTLFVLHVKFVQCEAAILQTFHKRLCIIKLDVRKGRKFNTELINR